MTLTLNDLDWMVHGRWETLHRADLTNEQAQELKDDAQVSGVTFDCGRSVDIAMIPGPFTRMGAKRCDRCCDRNGLPHGIGSPKNDPDCRAILGI